MRFCSFDRLNCTGWAGSLLMFAALLAAPSAKAFMPLNLSQGLPDISSSFMVVEYDAATGKLTSQGYATAFDFDGADPVDYFITSGVIDIDVTLDTMDMTATGDLTISGTIGDLGYGSGTLLTAQLAGFGAGSQAGDPLEFLWAVTGGDASGDFGPTAGTVLFMSGYPGDFASNFGTGTAPFNVTFTGQGFADTFGPSVPEPATTALLLAAVGLVGLRRPRRSMRCASA